MLECLGLIFFFCNMAKCLTDMGDVMESQFWAFQWGTEWSTDNKGTSHRGWETMKGIITPQCFALAARTLSVDSTLLCIKYSEILKSLKYKAFDLRNL